MTEVPSRRLAPLPAAVTARAAHLTLDAGWEHLIVMAYGTVTDGRPPLLFPRLASDDRIGFALARPEGPVLGFEVWEPFAVDLDALDDPELWDGPRFTVPVLGLRRVTPGEVLLAVRGRYAPEDSTLDAACFQEAIAVQDDDRESAAALFGAQVEAGDPRGHYGRGYCLHHLGRDREAYDHLRASTELAPWNAWAWCWLGRVAAALGWTGEARTAFRRALVLERSHGPETDAAAFLAELPDD